MEDHIDTGGLYNNWGIYSPYYYCKKCQHYHRYNSKIGKKHIGYKAWD